MRFEKLLSSVTVRKVTAGTEGGAPWTEPVVVGGDDFFRFPAQVIGEPHVLNESRREVVSGHDHQGPGGGAGFADLQAWNPRYRSTE